MHLFIRLLHQDLRNRVGHWNALLRLKQVYEYLRESWREQRKRNRMHGENIAKERRRERAKRRYKRSGCATSCARGALQWFIIVTRNIGIYIGKVPRAESKWSRQGSIPSIYLNAPTFHRYRVLTRSPFPAVFWLNYVDFHKRSALYARLHTIDFMLLIVYINPFSSFGYRTTRRTSLDASGNRSWHT